MDTAASVAGLLLSSTGSALLRKVLFQLDGVGLYGVRHKFEKPWFTTWESAVACWACLALIGFHQVWHRWQQHRALHGSSSKGVREPLLDLADGAGEVASSSRGLPESSKPRLASITWDAFGKLVVPAFCGIISVVLQGAGLRFISASTSQVLCGSAILFTAAMSLILLRCRLTAMHWTGILLVLAGTSIAACANVVWPIPNIKPGLHALPHMHSQAGVHFSPHADLPAVSKEARDTALGVVLTLLSQLLLAARLVSEELLLTSTDLHPLQVLGYEGLIGAIGVAAVGIPLTMLLPGPDPGNMLENWLDSCVLLWHSKDVAAVNAVFFTCVIGLNAFGLAVTCALGSVFRAVLLTTRTALVWAADVTLWELNVGEGKVGEAWAWPTSQLQLAAFTLLLLGTIIYAQGSSHLAVEYNAAAAKDEEEDGLLPSHATLVPSVTRLRPYTSLFIPPSRPALPASRPVASRMSVPAPGPNKVNAAARQPLLGRFSAPVHSAFAEPSPPLPAASHWRPFQSQGGRDQLPPTSPWDQPHPAAAHMDNIPENAQSQVDGLQQQPLPLPTLSSRLQKAPSFLATLTSASSWVIPRHQRLTAGQGVSTAHHPPASMPASHSRSMVPASVNSGPLFQPYHHQHGQVAAPSAASHNEERAHSTQARDDIFFAAEHMLDPPAGGSASLNNLAPPLQPPPDQSSRLPQIATSGSPSSRLSPSALTSGLAASPGSHNSATARAQTPVSPFQAWPASQPSQAATQDWQEHAVPGALLTQSAGSRRSSADSTSSSLLGHSPTPAKLSEIMSASRKQFQALPGLEETEDSSGSSASAADLADRIEGSLPLPPEDDSQPIATSTPHALPVPSEPGRAGHVSQRSSSGPSSPASAPLTIRTLGSHSPGRAHEPPPPFPTLGHSPTPEVLTARRASRRHMPERLPAHLEAGADEAEGPEADSRASTSGGSLERTTSKDMEDTPPSPAPSNSATSFLPRRSSNEAGVGLAALLAAGPFDRASFTGTFRSGRSTPGTPLTPGQRVVTAASHAEDARNAKAGLAGLLQDGAAGQLFGGRPPSMAAVAERLQTVNAVGQSHQTPE